MSKWAPANEYVPVTKGSTAVITLQSDGDVYGYMDASTTGVLLASASAGVTKVPTGSFSKITCTAPFILTTESAMSRFRGGQSGSSSGGGTLGAYVTWGGENNTEVTLNVPDGVDIPLSFREKNVTKVSGTGGGITDCGYMCSNCSNLASLTLDLPSATNCNSMCNSCSNLASLTLDLPSATNCNSMCNGCSNLTTLICNLGSMSTLDFASTTGNGGLGNVTTLQNLTILDGGLAACTSFNISASTALTDASIQTIIDALPDYSGTETSALVSFPPDRLTPAQQAQLTSKGWTWS